MIRLIKNNFLYYFKSRTKILISIAFVLSFFVMLNVYDNLELKSIEQEAYNTRKTQMQYYRLSYSGLGYDDVMDVEALDDTLYRVYNTYGDYKFLLNSGRLNYELTPQRQALNSLLLDVHYLMGEEYLELLPGEIPDLEFLRLEEERYKLLMDDLIPDDFNMYTITAANAPSRIFSGYFLFMMMIFTLLLFYDLFSKDFDSKTYRHLYTTSHSRSKIITSKILFSVIYLFSLIIIASLLLIIFLLIMKRNEYNVVASRAGSLNHMSIYNKNYFSSFNNDIQQALIPHWKLNLIVIGVGSSFLVLWTGLIGLLSFRLRSSNNTVIVGIYILLAIFAVNLTGFGQYLTFILPLFSFNLNPSITGEIALHYSTILVLSLIWILCLYFFLTLRVNQIDLLDGDQND